MVDTAEFASKGKNTPFQEAAFKGKVVGTFVGGEVRYRDEDLRELASNGRNQDMVSRWIVPVPRPAEQADGLSSSERYCSRKNASCE